MINSGSYTGVNEDSRIELRIDIDGTNLLNIVSGDVFRKDTSGESYLFSFICNEPQIQVKTSGPTIKGSIEGEFMRRVNFSVPIQGTISIEYTKPGGVNVAVTADYRGKVMMYNFIAKKYSNFFRTVTLDMDYAEGTELPPDKYDTHSVELRPPDLPQRNLSIKTCYADAGVEIKYVKKHDAIPISWAGDNAAWNDAELHHAMEQYMSGWGNKWQWKLHLLAATIYEEIDGKPEERVMGIMYDSSNNFQRQGAAVFYSALAKMFSGSDLDKEYLYTTVHELGHAFNLLHSFDKGLTVVSNLKPRPDSLSFMNYSDLYPTGNPPSTREEYEEHVREFWSNFRFNFDHDELVHIRHHYLPEVIMGADPFGAKGHLDVSPLEFSKLSYNGISPVEFIVRTSKEIFDHDEPVHVELKLKNLCDENISLPRDLHPSNRNVRLFIKGSNERIMEYQPLMKKCVRFENITLGPKDSPKDSMYESVFIDFGKDGFNFREPGEYEIWGLYNETVLSKIHKIRISYPKSKDDEEIAMLKHGWEQGHLLYLLGSDSQYLSNGHNKLLKVSSDYPDKALAAYVNMIEGMNLSWGFKDLVNLSVRPPDHEKALQCLEQADTKPEVFDNITYHRMVDQIADSLVALDKNKEASSRLSGLVDYFEKRKVKEWVINNIEDKARKIKQGQ